MTLEKRLHLVHPSYSSPRTPYNPLPPAGVNLLLDNSADIEAETAIGERPLHIAIKQNDFRIVKVKTLNPPETPGP